MQNALRMQHKKSYFFQAMNCILVSEINCIIRHFYVLSGCVPAPIASTHPMLITKYQKQVATLAEYQETWGY